MTEILRAVDVSLTQAVSRDLASSLRGVTIALEAGSRTVITGDAGCGMNLLLRVLSLMERPETGDVFWRGSSLKRLVPDEIGALRNQHFGFLFASPFLLPAFSVVENVAMPVLKIGGTSPEEARQRVAVALERVGMGDAENWAADELSIGQQHRVALARALVNRPEVLVAENLDRYLSDRDRQEFCELFTSIASEERLTLIASAGDAAVLPRPDRLIRMRAGQVAEDSAPVPVSTGGGSRE